MSEAPVKKFLQERIVDVEFNNLDTLDMLDMEGTGWFRRFSEWDRAKKLRPPEFQYMPKNTHSYAMHEVDA